MNLARKYDFFIAHSLFNANYYPYICYYCPDRNAFEIHSYEFENDQGLILVPFSDEHRGTIWAYFWELLDDDETELARSHSGPGFFAFMRENGLDERFEDARIRMEKALIDDWERENNLEIDYDQVSVKDFCN